MKLVEILERLKNINGIKILHILTTKGKGYRLAEEKQTIWHSPGFFNKETGEIQNLINLPLLNTKMYLDIL